MSACGFYVRVRNTPLLQANRLKGPLLDEVLRGLHRIVENCFSLGDPDADVPFDVGRMFYALRQYDEALRLYVLSWKTSGPHCITCHNIGLCQYALGQLESAVGWFDKAIQINSEYVKARWGVMRVLARVRFGRASFVCIRHVHALCRQWKQKVQLELARAALGESTSRLVIEPSDDSGTRFQLRFNGGTVLL